MIAADDGIQEFAVAEVGLALALEPDAPGARHRGTAARGARRVLAPGLSRRRRGCGGADADQGAKSVATSRRHVASNYRLRRKPAKICRPVLEYCVTSGSFAYAQRSSVWFVRFSPSMENDR